MANQINLSIRNKYLDLDLEDCILPKYLSNQFHKILEKQSLPIMVFKGALWEPKTIITNALAKKLNASIAALQFNPEPKSKTLKRGERTLTILRLLLKKHTDTGEKKVFIIENLNNFPSTMYPELFSLIEAEKFHHFVFFSADSRMRSYIKYYPQISFDFKIDHSPAEEAAYWDQCKKLVDQYNKSMHFNDLKTIIKSTYFFWISLFGRETLKKLRKELDIIPLNPIKESIVLNSPNRPIRLYPPVNSKV